LTADALISTEAGVFMAHHDDSDRSGEDIGFVDAISGEEDAFLALAAEISAPQALGTPPAAATGGPAASKEPKEKPMAIRPDAKAARAAAVKTAQAALVKAQANLAKAEADAAAPDDEMNDDIPDEDENKDKPAADGGEGEAPAAEGDAEQGEAAAIAASAEAKAHPGLALAAIQSNQTLAQFKANVAAAVAQRGGGGALREAMANAPRLRPDAQQTSSSARKALSTAEIVARNTAKGLEVHGHK
ncbi:MAG: hypothetical protein JSS35_08425, partial [Proteobacteria bacterium]|nr:hypothetical protein [Pseudomonadota bacterium]